MIFQTLIRIRRRRYLLTAIAITFLIILLFPVFAGSMLSLPNLHGYSMNPTAIADNSWEVAQQKPTLSLFQQLNLSSEQQQQIKQIHLQYRQKIIKKKNIITRLQQQLSDMMVGTEPVELLRAKNQQLNTLHQEMGLLHFESMLATREILTPQQREMFRKIVDSRFAK
ncbi:MAG TPA: Spy/CpxP family protein refolding chaperone [Coleofasciculaceae cyanobacterium]